MGMDELPKNPAGKLLKQKKEMRSIVIMGTKRAPIHLDWSCETIFLLDL